MDYISLPWQVSCQKNITEYARMDLQEEMDSRGSKVITWNSVTQGESFKRIGEIEAQLIKGVDHIDECVKCMYNKLGIRIPEVEIGCDHVEYLQYLIGSEEQKFWAIEDQATKLEKI